MKDLKTTIVGVLGLVSCGSFMLFRKEISPEAIELIATALTGLLSVGFILAKDSEEKPTIEVNPSKLPDDSQFFEKQKQEQRAVAAKKSKMKVVKNVD